MRKRHLLFLVKPDILTVLQQPGPASATVRSLHSRDTPHAHQHRQTWEWETHFVLSTRGSIMTVSVRRSASQQ